MSEMVPSDRPKRRLGVWIRRQGGVITVGFRDVARQLSDPAQVIFERADGTLTVRELADLLVAEYGISAEEALADTVEFVDTMTSCHLMVVLSSAAGD